MKMHDMGLMRKKPDISVATDETREKHYPSISLNEEQMPMLEGKDIGEKIDMMITFVVKGKREPYEWSDSKTNEYDLKMEKCWQHENKEKE